MELLETFLKNNQSLEDFYTEISNTVNNKVLPCAETFSSFTHERLLSPAEWFKAFAVLENAVDSGFDLQQTEEFFKLIFRGYDYHAAVCLNDDDYNYFWGMLNKLFDKFATTSTEALIEQALQLYNPRRNYKDHTRLLYLLEEAVKRGSENARVLLGYYLYTGFCCTPDKERGLELMNSAETDYYKQKAVIYKNFILSAEQKHAEAVEELDKLMAADIDQSLLRLVYEQKGFFLELEGKYEEAAEYYRKVNAENCSGFCSMHLGFLNYNRAISESDPYEGLRLMEEAFGLGRPEVARSLYYCYAQAEQEWQDEERGMYWLKKGYQYYDAYSTYQLANLHLYSEEYKDIEAGLMYLEEAIDMNYPDALACKGYMYYAGDIIDKDIEKSVEFFNRALELNYGYAGYRLGLIHEEGYFNDGEPDYATALSYYEKAAELGDIYGIELSGRYNLIGAGCEPNAEKALEYYTRGMEMGSSYCKVELAFMYEEGNGVEQDYVKVFELIKDAAENNYPYAFYLLGRCYRNAVGTEENPDEAIRYYQLAADANIAKGLTELALCYEEGYGVEANGKKALEYMTKAAEMDYVYAQYKVGCYYLYGLEGITTDYDESFNWMTKAAENEYPYALLEMGDYYLWDYADKNEKDKAYGYYVKAAEQDCVNDGLGLCLEYGIGVEENEAEGFRYYLKGAEDGYPRAMYNAGRCYYFGYGIKKNLNEAFRWFNDAANYQISSAMYYKGKMLMDGEGCSQNMEEGISLLTQAADNDYASAQYELANCYLVGKGVAPDDDKAMELFELAAENGHQGAAKVTGRRRKR